jgi:hypothetical protein
MWYLLGAIAVVAFVAVAVVLIRDWRSDDGNAP